MAYEKQTWACGEVVTADKLNHMEDGIASASEGGSCDCGFSCTETYASLFSGSVTTTGKDEYNPSGTQVNISRAFSEEEIPSSLKVTFNGTEYEAPVYEDGGLLFYGATQDWDDQEQKMVYDWSEYPFMISMNIGSNSIGIAVENDGTYQMQIQYSSVEVETSECFGKAVNSIIPQPLMLREDYYSDEATGTSGSILIDEATNEPITAQELGEAIENGRVVWTKDMYYKCLAPLRGFVMWNVCGGGQFKAWITAYGGNQSDLNLIEDKVFDATQNTNFTFINMEQQ